MKWFLKAAPTISDGPRSRDQIGGARTSFVDPGAPLNRPEPLKMPSRVTCKIMNISL